MALYKSSQLIVEAPEEEKEEVSNGDEIVVYEELPSKEEVLENTPNTLEISLKLPLLPGAPEDLPIEVSENEDKNKAQDKPQEKPKDLWDWQSGGLENFFNWVQNIFSHIPKHTGKEVSGVERAIAYLKKANSEISKAAQSDYDGHLDISKLEDARCQIEEGINRLEEHLEKLQDAKKPKKKKADTQNEIVKQSQKSTHVGGIIITVPLLISSIARYCINGMVSSGKDMEELVEGQIKKHKLNDSQQTELIQLLTDMGYAVRRSRGYLIDEKDKDPDQSEWITNYPA